MMKIADNVARKCYPALLIFLSVRFRVSDFRE
jgi:hypothetical protein